MSQEEEKIKRGKYLLKVDTRVRGTSKHLGDDETKFYRDAMKTATTELIQRRDYLIFDCD